MLQTPERKITLEEIAELEEPIKNIIGKIKERIEKGEYGIIIGDDASGRIPALVLGGLIKKISKLRNLSEPNIIFIPGKLNNPQDEKMAEMLQNHLSKYGVKKEGRVLVVTEAIVSGQTLSVLSALLKKLGFVADIAAIGIEDQYSFMENEREKNLGNSNIISGDYIRKGSLGESHTPLVYGKRREKTGVYKNSGDLKSQSVKSMYGNTQINKTEIQKKINETRIEANILVDKLVDWYLAQNK